MQQEKIRNLRTPVIVEGTVFYNDRRRRIDLKKPIRDMFCKIATEDVRYVMELFLCKQSAKQRLDEMLEDGVMPVMLHFVKVTRRQERENE
jgi:hypothetical protein